MANSFKSIQICLDEVFFCVEQCRFDVLKVLFDCSAFCCGFLLLNQLLLPEVDCTVKFCILLWLSSAEPMWCYCLSFSTILFGYLQSSITYVDYEKTQTVGVSWNQYLFIQEFTCLFLVVSFSKESLNKGNQCFYALQSCTIWFTGHPSNKDIKKDVNNSCKISDTKIHVLMTHSQVHRKTE